MMDASEHQDGGGRENNEDNDGGHDDDNQRGHAVAGKLFSWGQKNIECGILRDLYRRI